MSKDCLVLGVDYQPLTLVPLSVISWDKALSKVYKGNATVVEEYDDWILRSQTMSVKVPAIIALTNKRKVRHKVRLSRYNILLRKMELRTRNPIQTLVQTLTRLFHF